MARQRRGGVRRSRSRASRASTARVARSNSRPTCLAGRGEPGGRADPVQGPTLRRRGRARPRQDVVPWRRRGGPPRGAAPRPSRAGPARRSPRPRTGSGARTSAAKSASVTSTSCPTPHTTGIGCATTARTTRSSLNAHRSSSEPPPRARIVTAGASSGRPASRAGVGVALDPAERGHDARGRPVALDPRGHEHDLRRAASAGPARG